MSNFLQTLDKNLKTIFSKPEEKPVSMSVPPALKTIKENLAPSKVVPPALSTIKQNLQPKAPITTIPKKVPKEAEKRLAEISGKKIATDVAKVPVDLGRMLITRPIRMVAQSFQDIGGYLGDKEYSPEAYVAKTPVEKALFGEEPIDSAVSWKKRQDKEVENLTTGQSPYNKNLITTLGFLASFAPLADILPGGKGKEKILEKVIKGPLDEIIEIGVKSTDDVSSFNVLKNYVEENIAKENAPLLTAAKTKKEAENVLRESVAKQLQITQHDAILRADELTAKQKAAPLTADELEELTFLQKNKNKPEAIILANKVAESKDVLPIKERKYITSAKASEDISNDVSREINETYTQKSNKELVDKSVARVNEDFEEAKKFARENSTDEAVATRVAVDKELSARYANATSAEEKAKYATELKDSIISHSRLATEEGRTVQANALLGKQTPEGMLRTTAREIEKYNKTAGTKIPQITEETVKKVLNAGDEIAKLPEGLPKQVATKKLVDDLEALIPSPVWKKIVNVWKAGLLTGVKTSGVNIQSSFFNGVVEIAKDLPATGIDMATSLFTGQRTKAFTLRGLGQGGMEGVKKGWNYLRTGISEEKAANALEFNKVHFDSKPGKILQAYTDGIYRVIGSEDMPFFYGALRRSLAEQAIVTAKNQKKIFTSNAERTKFIQNFIDNPPKEALNLADLDAKIATFKNDTAIGNMAQAIQNAPGLGPVSQLTVLPFAKTPSAVATALWNYAPTGAITTLYKSFKGGQFNQKEFAEGLGRVATGAGALWLGSQLFKDDLISLGYPKDEKERAQWEATGKIPNSLKIGDTWYPLIQLGPIGGAIGIGGYVEQGKEETGSIAGGAITGLFGGVKGLTEQTFLTGVKNLLDVVDDPENKAELYAGRVLGSIIPTVVSDFSQSMDEYQRKSNSFLDPLKSRIPELRKTLRPKLDVWGQPIERNRSAVSTVINPIRLSNTIQGTLNTEVERLDMLGEDIRPTKVDAKIGNVKLDKDEYYIFQRMYGEILGVGLESLIKNKEYQSMAPDEQAKLFKDGVSDIRKGVSEVILPVIIQKKYDLPEDVDPKLATDLVDQLSKVSEEFNKSSVEKQRKLILKLLDN